VDHHGVSSILDAHGLAPNGFRSKSFPARKSQPIEQGGMATGSIHGTGRSRGERPGLLRHRRRGNAGARPYLK
jgi:hypothetical protein